MAGPSSKGVARRVTEGALLRAVLLFGLCGCTLDFDRFGGEAGGGLDAGDGGGAGAAGSGPQGVDGGPLDAAVRDAAPAVREDAEVDAAVGGGGKDAGLDGSSSGPTELGGNCAVDGDCQSNVCEAKSCVECRDVSSCSDAELCIEHRCVPNRKPSTIWLSSGGGVTAATGYRLRLSAGAPQPMGRTSASGFRLLLGPSLQVR